MCERRTGSTGSVSLSLWNDESDPETLSLFKAVVSLKRNRFVEDNVSSVQMTFPSEIADDVDVFEEEEEAEVEVDTGGFKTFSIVEDYADDDDDDDELLMPSSDGIEDAVAAFVALDDKPDDVQQDDIPLPRATESFPFGVKERPVREQFSFKSRLKTLLADKSIWTNAGPVLVLGLLIYSIVFVMAERPYVMFLNGEKIAFVSTIENGQRLLEQANLELSSPYPAESNFRHSAVIHYTRDGVETKTKPTDDQTILDTLKTDITWLIDGWTIIVSNERTVFLASREQALEVLDNVKKSYLPEGDHLTILNAEFVEPVDILMEEIQVSDLGTSDQAFRTLTEGREPIREYRVQSGDSYWAIANRNNMTVDELKMINGATSDTLAIGTILRLNVPKPLLSVRTTVS